MEFKKSKFVYLVESPNLGFLDPNSTHFCPYCRSKYLHVDFPFLGKNLLEEKIITQEDLVWVKLRSDFRAIKNTDAYINYYSESYYKYREKLGGGTELKNFIMKNLQKFDFIKNEYLKKKGLSKIDDNFSNKIFYYYFRNFHNTFLYEDKDTILEDYFDFDMLKILNSQLLEKGIVQQEDLVWFCDEFLQVEDFLLINSKYQELKENKKQYYRKVYDYLKKNEHPNVVFNANKWETLNNMLKKQLKEGIITQSDLHWLELSKIQDKESVEYKELMENKMQYYGKIYKNLVENKENLYKFKYMDEKLNFNDEVIISFLCDLEFEKLMRVVSIYPWDLEYDYVEEQPLCYFFPKPEHEVDEAFSSLKVRLSLFNDSIEDKEDEILESSLEKIKDLEDQNLDFLLDSLKTAKFKAWENTRVELNEIFFELVAGKVITKVKNSQILFDPNPQEDFSFYQPMKNPQNCLAFYYHRADKNNAIEQNRTNYFYFEFHWKTTETNIFHELFGFNVSKNLDNVIYAAYRNGLDYFAGVYKKVLEEEDLEKQEKLLKYFLAFKNNLWDYLVSSTSFSLHRNLSRLFVDFILVAFSLREGMPIELRNSSGESLNWWEECLKEITNLDPASVHVDFDDKIMYSKSVENYILESYSWSSGRYFMIVFHNLSRGSIPHQRFNLPIREVLGIDDNNDTGYFWDTDKTYNVWFNITNKREGHKRKTNPKME